MHHSFQIGVLTFGEISPDPATGRIPSARARMVETLEQAVLADQTRAAVNVASLAKSRGA